MNRRRLDFTLVLDITASPYANADLVQVAATNRRLAKWQGSAPLS